MGGGGSRWMLGRHIPSAVVAALWLGGAAFAGPGGVRRPGSVSPLLATSTDHGPASRTDRHRIVVGLALRDRDGLEAFLADIQDPASPTYHRFLTQAEFNARYAPTEADEAAVVAHL